MTDLSFIASGFKVEGEVLDISPLGEGFINDTYVVRTSPGSPDCILQRKNHYVFPDVPAMMDNIVAVTEHIRKKVSDPSRETLTVIPTKDGKYCFKDADGNFWAMCTFIEGSVSYDRADTLELCRQGGIGIGRFHTQLADFDKPLAEVIKGFHNIRWRFQQWDEALKRDAAGRLAGLEKEVAFIEDRRKEMLSFWSLVETGVIPTRVSHNDTKISNILFDKESGDVLCAIDLDTVMSSTSLNDVGDALRAYTNTGAEDDPDLDNVSMDIERFKAYIEGYLSERRSTLTQSEIDHLAFSGRYITYEQVLRFLMDYIDGDIYYKTKYPEHNLVRTHAQMKLLLSMEEQYETACGIVRSLSADNEGDIGK